MACLSPLPQRTRWWHTHTLIYGWCQLARTSSHLLQKAERPEVVLSIPLANHVRKLGVRVPDRLDFNASHMNRCRRTRRVECQSFLFVAKQPEQGAMHPNEEGMMGLKVAPTGDCVKGIKWWGNCTFL